MRRRLAASDAIARRILASLRELPLLLRRFGPGELEEMRRRNQTSTDWKPPSLGTKIDDGCSFGSSRWEAPSQLSKVIRSVFKPPDYGSLVGRPDVLSCLKVRRGFRPSHGNTSLAEGCEIIAIWDVVA